EPLHPEALAVPRCPPWGARNVRVIGGKLRRLRGSNATDETARTQDLAGEEQIVLDVQPAPGGHLETRRYGQFGEKRQAIPVPGVTHWGQYPEGDQVDGAVSELLGRAPFRFRVLMEPTHTELARRLQEAAAVAPFR